MPILRWAGVAAFSMDSRRARGWVGLVESEGPLGGGCAGLRRVEAEGEGADEGEGSGPCGKMGAPGGRGECSVGGLGAVAGGLPKRQRLWTRAMVPTK